jgi:hypothetical protein
MHVNVLLWNTEKVLKKDGKWIQKLIKLLGQSFIPLNHYIGFICSPSTRHLPKSVYQTSKLKRTMLEAQRVKEERRRKHTREGETIPKPEKKKLVIAEQN